MKKAFGKEAKENTSKSNRNSMAMMKRLNESLNVRWRTRPMQEGNKSQIQMSDNYISMERRKSRA